MLTSETIIPQITILPDGQLQVQTERVILDDGAEIARSTERYVVYPGADLDREHPRVKMAGDVFHTPDVVLAFVNGLAASHQPEIPEPEV